MADIADDVLSHLGLDVDSELKHYGKKGMKWGQRHERGPDGKVGRTLSDDHVTSRELKAKKRSEMSNAELKKVNERLQLENTNNELQSRSALAKIKKGTTIAGTILAVGTTITTAYNFYNSPAGKAIVNGVKKTFEETT